MKRLNFNIKDRKILYMILGISFISVFTLTVAYAALNAVLNISGSAQVSSAEWDVHFDNVKVINGSVSGNDPRITSATTATFSTVLNMPGEFYEFTIDVVNDGSIDAMIENITKTPSLTSEQAKYLKYDITYQNGESITTRQLVEKNSFVRLKVRLEYRSDVTSSDLPISTETSNLGLKLDYIQSDGSGSVVSNGGISTRIVSGDLDTVGSEVCIDNECFYVISDTDTDVTLFAKYNLYVGGVYNSGWTAYGDEATGIQDSSMIGHCTTPANGTTPFSSTNYWSTTVSSYPSYVYDSNSTLYNYVESYRIYLESQGVEIEEARLIKMEELESLGCSSSSQSCSGAPEWVYGTTYWTGTSNTVSSIYSVDCNAYFHNINQLHDEYCGVRPVIVISKFQF